MEVYFDNSSTTKPYDEVCALMFDIMKNDYGNPSSLHRLGIDAEHIMKTAKTRCAEALKGEPGEIFFTSGGTESDNLAILGAAAANRGRHMITTPIEHPAVLNTAKELKNRGYDVEYVPVDTDGSVDLEAFEKMLRPDTFLVSAMTVNNEIGTVEPISEMAKIYKEKNPKGIFHTDAVQAFGKVAIDVRSLPIDMVTISGHKIHGPKGVGALYVRKGTKINPVIFGGGQQGNLRSGTENVSGIAGLGLAAEISNRDLEAKAEKMGALRERLKEGILKLGDVRINTPECCAPHILNVSFGGIKSEVLLHSLEGENIFVSSGSACSSRKKEPDYVLLEIGVPSDFMEGSIRFSLSEFSTAEETDKVIDALNRIVPRLRRLNIS